MSPDLVGRESEFAVLTGLWETVAHSKPGLALIEGDEGMGKTRLAEEFLRWAGQQNPRPVVLRARAFEAEGGRPWVVLRHLLAGLASAPGLAAAPAGTLKALSAFVPEIAEQFRSLPPTPPDKLQAETVARALADVAAEVPVVVFLDDAHHADPQSRELIEVLFRHPIGGVLIILVSIPNHFPGLTRLDRDHASTGLSRIQLTPLSQADVEHVLASMADFAPADRHALAARLGADGGGNPLVVTELITTLADQGVVAPGPDGLWALHEDLADEPLPIPASLREAACTRLRQLPTEAVRVLEAAAVLGRESELGVLRAATGLDLARLDDALDQLVGRRFLRIAAHGSSRLEFSHETVRQVVYQEMSPVRREETHRRVWRALRQTKPRDAAQRSAIEHHRSRFARRRPSKVAWLTAAALVLILGVGATLLIEKRAKAAASPTLVAVMPFTVRGSPRYAYLGEGMVNLLSANLDGVGDVRTVDPRGLLAFVSENPQDPKSGLAAAERFGAGLFVLGDVIETNGRIDLAAYLYDSLGGLQTAVRASAAAEEGISGAVNEIARQILVSHREGPGEEITRLAVVTSASLPALKAYLEGERWLREGNFSSAVEAFQSATRADTAFALAYYRLAIAAEWDQEMNLPEWAAEQAVRHGSRLSERSRGLVEALLAWRKGDAGGARDRYTAILLRHPDDVEAWFQLGEVLFHSSPVHGRSIAEAKHAWERVLYFEPQNRFALLHLARIAAAADDSAGLRTHLRVATAPDASPDARLLEVAAWRAIVFRNRREEDRAIAQLRQTTTQSNIVWQLVTFSRNLAASERFARVLLENQHAEFGSNLLAHLDLARGAWGSAVPRFGSSEVEITSIIARAFVASLPFVPVERERLLQLRNELKAMNPDGLSVDRNLGLGDVVTPHRQIQGYLLGTLSARAGDNAAALQYASELERMESPPHLAKLAHNLASGIRARAARNQGHPEAALQLLEGVKPTARREEVSQSPFFALAMERYLRAELLRELGRGEEALTWYASMAQLSPFELVFLAPSHMRRAEIYEGLGKRAEAAGHYARFIELWKDADPESQSLVAEARMKLERVQP